MASRKAKTSGAAVELHKLHRRLFQKLQADARTLLGEPPASISRYERSAMKSLAPALRRRARHASSAELVRAVRAADVTLVGDYHTFAQAQRAALRIAREAARPGERWILGLELFPSTSQRELDQYLGGRLSENAFLKKIRYAENWGFPWENYKPLLEWARGAGVRVVALNRPEEAFFAALEKREARELRERDDWSAGIITDLFAAARAEKVRARMLVVYGELHVAAPHMPARIERISRAFLGKPLKTVVVHQNQDALFWKALEELKSGFVESLRLDRRTFCVFSGTPWTQLQSLIHWAEGWADDAAESHEDEEDDDEETRPPRVHHAPQSVDPLHCLSQMRLYGDGLARFLGVAPAPVDHLRLEVLEGDRALADSPALSRDERAITAWQLKRERRLYLPALGVAYGGTVSQNGLVELAALHLLHYRRSEKRLFGREEADLERVVAFSAFGFFASLLLNPKRKWADAARLSRPPKGLPSELARSHRLAARLIANVQSRRPANLAGATRAESAPVAFVACTLAGRALGARIFMRMLEGSATTAEIRAAFFARGRDGWQTRLRRCLN